MVESQTKYGKIEDFYIQVSRGQIPGHATVRMHGYNPVLGTSPATIWPLASIRAMPTAAQQIRVVSSSTDDALTGIGARTIVIEGLSSNYTPLTEVINLNGTTPVTTSASFFRIQSASVTNAGSSRVNVGNITFTNAGNTQTFDIIPAE